MGNLVATVLIGVAVYLTASHSRSDVTSSTRKSKTPSPHSDSTASIYTFKLTQSPFWCWNSEVVLQNLVKKGQMSPSKDVSCLPLGSDRQHLVPYESRNRPPNDHYQVGSNLSPPPQAVKSNVTSLFFFFLSLLSFHDGSASEPQRSEGHVWRPDQQEIDPAAVSWPGFMVPVYELHSIKILCGDLRSELLIFPSLPFQRQLVFLECLLQFCWWLPQNQNISTWLELFCILIQVAFPTLWCLK